VEAGKKGGSMMRKKVSTILTYIVLILSLTLMISPIVSAKSNNLLKCDVNIEINWDFIGFGVGTSPYSWIGTVSGDINGELYVALIEAWFPAPGTEHFIEEWGIMTSNGWINGTSKGKWTMANYKWVANGEITYADPDWEHLVGSKMQYSGTTSEFPVPFGTPVIGTGKMHITHNK
jgi:hypothetical protein